MRRHSGRNRLKQSFKSTELGLRTSAQYDSVLFYTSTRKWQEQALEMAKLSESNRFRSHRSDDFFFLKTCKKTTCSSSKTRRRKKSSNLHEAPREQDSFSLNSFLFPIISRQSKELRSRNSYALCVQSEWKIFRVKTDNQTEKMTERKVWKADIFHQEQQKNKNFLFYPCSISWLLDVAQDIKCILEKKIALNHSFFAPGWPQSN